MIEIGGYVYILTNKYHTVLHIGSTVDLHERMNQHRSKLVPKSFTTRYNCNLLVYYNFHDTIIEAREYEYKLKKWRREKKERLISESNPWWNDLTTYIES